MSKKRTRTCCLVIDASVAHPAGTQHPTGPECSDFLTSVRSVCHRMAWSKNIKAEWDKHQSIFALQWLVTMMNLKKLREIKDEELTELREAIKTHSSDPNVAPIMLKDVHLVEAALATDARVASLDDNARGHFSRLATAFDSLRPIIWVNPTISEEKAVKWLEAGAPIQRRRQLIQFRS
jgi:hypothetical protein